MTFDKVLAERLCAEAEEDDARCDAPSLSDRSASQFACGVRQRRHRERDLAAQLRAAMAEVERMRPVYEAAIDWRERKYPRARSWRVHMDDAELVSAIDTALAEQGGRRG